MRIKKLIARIFDLPNAFRVLDIMDQAGCDIKQVDDTGWWAIYPKWYVSKQDAEDLRRIILSKQQYKARNRLWYRVVFRQYRSGYRPSGCWYHGEK